MSRRRPATLGATLIAVLALPAMAAAHISVHPNTVPAGAFATLNLRVPGEEENAYAYKVAMQVPAGFISLDTENVPGWSVETKTKKLASPIETDDGKIDEEVSEVIWTGDRKEGKLADGAFVQFPLSVAIPGEDEGKLLPFKTLEYYSNGKVARWIGTPESEYPAPTIDITEKGGVIADVADGEAGPATAGAPSGEAQSSDMAMSGEAEAPAGVEASASGSDDARAIVALAVGALGLITGGGALLLARRRA